MPKPDSAYPRGPQTAYDTALGWRLVNPKMGALRNSADGENPSDDGPEAVPIVRIGRPPLRAPRQFRPGKWLNPALAAFEATIRTLRAVAASSSRGVERRPTVLAKAAAELGKAASTRAVRRGSLCRAQGRERRRCDRPTLRRDADFLCRNAGWSFAGDMASAPDTSFRDALRLPICRVP